MNKVKLFLTVLSILIAVMPITVQVIRHRDNPVGLILPPTIDDLLNGGVGDLSDADIVSYAGMTFPLPSLSGAPMLSQDNTVKLVYTFTNPLEGTITIVSMDAEIVCKEHNFTIGTVFVEPTTFEPHQTLDLNLTCILTPQATEHIKTHHQGQDILNTEFKNFSVELRDIKIEMDHRKLGPIQIPQLTLLLQTLTNNITQHPFLPSISR
ncbi:MAG: hypothetical protein FWD52_09300 [Candidatus Bathyarchaeota archaeon]|nr:hypothetical protein [Candidatus Termiticorpusculum sp.]